MEVFSIKVTETRTQTIEIEAENRQQALELAEKEYFDNLLDYDVLFNPEDTTFE